MFRDVIWSAFENTGNIDAYMLFKEIDSKNKTENDEHVKKNEFSEIN